VHAAYREPLVNNILVVREMGKQIYIQEKLQPPTNPQAIREAYEEFYHKASSGSWWRDILGSGEWKRIFLYAAEAYGIFTIGEMIGRR
jgi:F-type H+-transporting ATPase subunit g